MAQQADARAAAAAAALEEEKRLRARAEGEPAALEDLPLDEMEALLARMQRGLSNTLARVQRCDTIALTFVISPPRPVRVGA